MFVQLNLKLASRWLNMKKIEKTFYGHEAVDWILEAGKYARNRLQAVGLCSHLLHTGFIWKAGQPPPTEKQTEDKKSTQSAPAEQEFSEAGMFVFTPKFEKELASLQLRQRNLEQVLVTSPDESRKMVQSSASSNPTNQQTSSPQVAQAYLKDLSALAGNCPFFFSILH
jgi:hypothetical protein